jgi:PAS domain S-box-containing protein
MTQSDEKFRILFENLASGIAVYSSTDGDHFICSGMNRTGEQMSGVRFQDIAGKEVREVFPGVVGMGRYELFRRVWASGTAESLPTTYYDDQRMSRYYNNNVYKISDTEIAAVFDDVTTRKVAGDELLRSEAQLRVLFETSHAGIIVVDPAGIITLANNRMAELFGCSMEELVGSRYPDHVPPDQRSTGDDRMRKLIAGEIDHVGTERHYIRKDGTDFWGHLSGRRHEDSGGNLISLVGQIADITERKKLEGELNDSLEQFSLFMKYSPVYTFIKRIEDNQSRVLQISDNYVDMVGKPAEELRGRTMYDLFPEDFARKITEDDLMVASEGKVIELEEQLNDRTYTTIKFPILREGKDNLVAGFTIDITDRKRAENEHEQLEKQMLHAQKLESLGVLAGGIAHDFNNILMAIIGNADLALMRINKESPAVENLHRIEQAAARAADLAKQMLAYSGKGKFVVEHIDLNRLLEEMLHMLEVSISKKAILRLNQHHPLPPVEADATQMRQIVMNLVINASEAIGDRSGVIAITTGCMDCDRGYLKDVWLDENLSDGLYVYLEIADSGCGMDKETLSKLFDPFFTTKFTGRGLGMAAVLGIIRGHHGAIKVYSEPGRGTTFKILLPASGRPDEIFNGKPQGDTWQGSGTVLLVDDEETVRGIGAEMLKELGFSTVTAEDGREAVEIFTSRNDISFVILDLTMPHMDGEQCFRELRQLKPDVKVIMSSGYNEQEVAGKFAGKGLAGFLQKPYKLSTLQDVIRKL